MDDRTFYAIDNNEVSEMRTFLSQVDSVIKLMNAGISIDTKPLQKQLNAVRRIVGEDYLVAKKLDF